MGFSAMVKAFYKFENNGVDSTGNGYNGVSVGTPIYDSTIKKYDNYSLKNTNALNNFISIGGTDIQSDIGALTSGGYTMQFWARVDAFTNSDAVFFQKRGDVNSDGGCWAYFTSVGSYYGPNLISIKWNGNHDYNIAGVFNSTSDLGRWYRIQFEYDIDNNQMKLYIDGILKLTLNSAVNIFANNDTVFNLGGSGQFNWSNTKYIDNVAFASVLMGGAEIVEISATGAKSVNSNSNISNMGSNVKKVISNNNIAGGF